MRRAIQRNCVWFVVCLLCIRSATCETFQCTQKIEAYDVKQPDRIIGYFEPSTTLEIEEFVPETKMYRVLLKAPDGSEVRALCRPDGLGKKAADAEEKKPLPAPASKTSDGNAPSPDKSPPVGFGKAASGTPPIFASLKEFESSIWETPASKFALQQSSLGFKWVSAAENKESRCGTPLDFLDQPVVETIARFQDGRLDEVRLLMFGRGDSRTEMGEEAYASAMKTLETQLNTWTAGKGLDAWVQGNAADTKRKSWFKFPLRIDLESNVTRNVKEKVGFKEQDRTIRFRTEFIRIVISPYDGKSDVTQLVKPNFQSGQTATVHKADLKEHIKTEAKGDVYLDGVPMVDQGQKGYCVCASMERVMRYYGIDVDQNEMAKAANTMASGTNPEAMFKALKKLGGQFSMNVREHIDFDFKDFLKEIEVYNRVAKKNKVQEVFLPKAGNYVVDIGAVYESMDAATLKEVRLKHANEKTKFVKDVSDLIDKGSPALWGVELGFADETPALPQKRGGHMRLIIGYNSKTSEIIYTDSWGAGHEFKHMSVDDAFSITQGLYSVTPSS